MNWYIIRTLSGFEEEVKSEIEQQFQVNSRSDFLGEIRVPTTNVPEIRRGRRVEVTRVTYPSHVLIRMELNGETQQLIKNLPHVTGFFGGDKPIPLSEEEIDKILQPTSVRANTLPKDFFKPGDQVKILDGKFCNFTATVEDVDAERERLKVIVSLFGRPTPIILGYSRVEKI